jgi:hypothetical protein
MHYAFDRYVFVTKELLRVKPIFQWLYENRLQWAFMERELSDQQQHGSGARHGQMRGNYIEGPRNIDSMPSPTTI